MRNKLIAGFAELAIVAAAAAAFLQRSSAPGVRFATLSGENFATSDLRGKVVRVARAGREGARRACLALPGLLLREP